MSGVGVTGREARRPRDVAQPPEGYGETTRKATDAEPHRKYNHFNYWRRRLPDVTSDLKNGDLRHLDVHGKGRSLSPDGSTVTPLGKPAQDYAQVRSRSQDRSSGPESERSPRTTTLVLFDPEAGESSTDPEPHAKGSHSPAQAGIHHLDLALRRHIDLDGDDDVCEEQLRLGRHRPKSGSVCDYPR